MAKFGSAAPWERDMASLSITLFLVDGAPQGLRIAKVGNWTGIALVCPRAELAKLKKRGEIHSAGVYLLVGPTDPPSPTRLRIYVGESDNVWKRLQGHNDRTEFWEWVVAFVSTDNRINKAHARWLEAKLYQDVRDAKRADVENGNEPGEKDLPEHEVADMEGFLERMRLLLPVLGLDVLAASTQQAPAQGVVTLKLESGKAKAECAVREGQFIIKKGSTGKGTDQESLAASYRDLRATLKKDGVLEASGDGLLKFTQDFAFASPSAAASMVTGSNVNGRAAWKVVGEDITYKEWQEQQVQGTAPATVNQQ
jgi:hypothetical protein